MTNGLSAASTASSNPNDPIYWYTIAQECRSQGDVAGWREATDKALELPHRTPQQRYCRAWSKLAMGEWSGWSDYESRVFLPDNLPQPLRFVDKIRWTHSVWDGTDDLHDKTVLVVPEQGIGDAIQMLRYLPVLAERAGAVIAAVYPRLVPLVQYNFGDRLTVAIDGVNKPLAFDYYVYSMSLPSALGGLPPFVPLRAPGRRPPLPRRTRRVRAGICWAGNPDYPDDESRSMPVARIVPLLARRDIEWHSLQVGGRALDADGYPAMRRPWPPLFNFGDTADFLAELDLVVTVDTAVGHLAGSLGVPTFLLLSHCPDHRWGMGDRTPWYPTMRVLRQREAGDWDTVIATLQLLLDDSASDSLRADPLNGAHGDEQPVVASHA
jgi:hypothetical protein